MFGRAQQFSIELMKSLSVEARGEARARVSGRQLVATMSPVAGKKCARTGPDSRQYHQLSPVIRTQLQMWRWRHQPASLWCRDLVGKGHFHTFHFNLRPRTCLCWTRWAHSPGCRPPPSAACPWSPRRTWSGSPSCIYWWRPPRGAWPPWACCRRLPRLCSSQSRNTCTCSLY